MGLDTFAARSTDEEDLGLTEEDFEAFEKADVHLCGGLLSSGGTSFRGKVYASLIHKITKESLYQDWIPPGVVKKMWQALEDCNPEEAVKDKDGEDSTDPSVVIELRKFFRVCAERGFGLIGWW